MTAPPLRTAIIGQGRSGYAIHAAALGKMRRLFRVLAVADPLPERCTDAAAAFGCATFANHHDLLAAVPDLDLVINATPSHLHIPVTRDLLTAGYNVLCEKPFGRRAADVDAMIALARRKKRLLAVFQQSRSAPYFQQVCKVIESGVLGRIVMIKIAFNGFARRWDWQTLQELDGGNLLNTGPHPLDQALHLFAPEAMPDVFCRMDRVLTLGNAEDHVKLILSGPGRPLIDVEISSCCAYPPVTYQIYAEHGGLSGSTDQMDWKYVNRRSLSVRQLVREPLPQRAYCSEKLAWIERKWILPKNQANLFDVTSKRFYNNLADALNHGKPLTVSLREVRRQIAVIEECHRQNPLPKTEFLPKSVKSPRSKRRRPL